MDSAHISQTYSVFRHTDRKNRPDRETCSRTPCGFAEHADANAARGIAARGHVVWRGRAASHVAGDVP
ncbi:hypothetical protein GCM10010517_75170 [Streptosporangium fragile]|uniref:Transposase n=1 Tax=Streptosporangium fragile TaxID=46186 RepID=A0ABP6IT58_9ACTN